MARKTILLQSCVLAGVAFASQNCYYPNGTVDNFYVPCDAGAINSACCAPGDECLTNGLCRPAESTGVANDYWRDLCTDQSWESDACAKYCYNQSTSDTAGDGTFFVTACSWNTYCCADPGVWDNDKNAYACCDEPVGVFTAGPAKWLSGPKVITATYSRAATSSSSSSAASSTSTSQPSTTTPHTTTLTHSPSLTPQQVQAQSSSSSGGLGTGDKAAIGVCVGVAGLAAILVGAWFFLRRSRQKEQGTQFQDGNDQEQTGEKPIYAHYAPITDNTHQQFYDPPISSQGHVDGAPQPMELEGAKLHELTDQTMSKQMNRSELE